VTLASIALASSETTISVLFVHNECDDDMTLVNDTAREIAQSITRMREPQPTLTYARLVPRAFGRARGGTLPGQFRQVIDADASKPARTDVQLHTDPGQPHGGPWFLGEEVGAIIDGFPLPITKASQAVTL